MTVTLVPVQVELDSLMQMAFHSHCRGESDLADPAKIKTQRLGNNGWELSVANVGNTSGSFHHDVKKLYN